MKTPSLLIAFGLVLLVGAPAFADHARGDPSLHLHDDVDRDYQADIVFSGGTALAYWTVDFSDAAPVVTSTYAGNAGPGYSVVAVSEFTGDRAADVLWTNGSHLKMWINDGLGRYTPASVGHYGAGWEPFAAGDINADGRSDLIFRNGTHLAFWLMDGLDVISVHYAGDGGDGYRVVAISDFVRDGNSARNSVDVLWANGSQMKLWVSDAATRTFQPSAIGSYGGGWEPFAAADIDEDARAEILFRGGTHIAYGNVLRTVSGAFSYEGHYAGDGGPGFRVIGVSNYSRDYTGSGMDLLWTNGSELKLWHGTCPAWDWDYGCGVPNFVPQRIGTYGGGWQPLEMLVPQE